MEFTGENIWFGKAGELLLSIAFGSALLSAIAYSLCSKDAITLSSGVWKKIGRGGFIVHCTAVFGTISLILFLLVAHRFEYHYVWQHSNLQTPLHYIFSCLWEGQEGSFLLWMFWNSVLGLILLKTSNGWEPSTMAVVAMVEMFLASMLLGINIGGYNIGSNPFILLRQHPDMVNMPFATMAGYLQSIDGRGLNPLLQNYWMLIHPPVLFLGFASTLIPFAYCIAALWKKRFTDWQKPALPWTFFGVMVLGTGVLMGGAWAYEALSFGGFWAWDPVENASLVPWLTFVAAGHILLINTHREQSYRIGFVVTILTFAGILYSTFLTRSGILGDTSVHAFTDLGMSGQLLIYLLTFFILGFFLLVKNWKQIPHASQEEHLLSREFWMFVGALVLCISSFQIIFSTSIPVINTVFGTKLAPPVDPIAHYNGWQIPFAIIVAAGIAIGQFFKFQRTLFREFLKKITLSLMISIALTGLSVWCLQLFKIHYCLLLFTTFFAVIANADYIIRIRKGNLKKSGAAIAHAGIGMILMGALIAASASRIISQNTSGIDVSSLGKEFNNKENIMLIRGDRLRMGEYFVTYREKEKKGINLFFNIDFFNSDSAADRVKLFTLSPRVQLNARMGNVAEPGTKHFFTHDIYSHVTFADLSVDEQMDTINFGEPSVRPVSVGDTILFNRGTIVVGGIRKIWDSTAKDTTGNNLFPFGISPDSVEIGVAADLIITDFHGDSHRAEPILVIFRTNQTESPWVEIPEEGLKISFTGIFPETKKIQLSVREKKSIKRDFIILKAIVFPYINILWIGGVVFILGCILALVQRIRKKVS